MIPDQQLSASFWNDGLMENIVDRRMNIGRLIEIYLTRACTSGIIFLNWRNPKVSKKFLDPYLGSMDRDFWDLTKMNGFENENPYPLQFVSHVVSSAFYE